MIRLRLWRQRRRIIMAMAFAALAGLGFGGIGWLWPMTGALAAGAVTAVTVVAAPGLRWSVLKMTLVAALAAAVYPFVGDSPLGYGLLALSTLGLLLLPCSWLDEIKLPWTQQAMAAVEIARSVDTVWRVVRPVPGATFWDPSVERITLGTDPDGLNIERRAANGRLVIQDLQLLEVAPLRYLKIRDRSYPEPQDGGQVTITAFGFGGDHETCRLLLIEGAWNRPLWTSVSLWLDDYLADHADHMRAMIERRPDPSLRGTFLRARGKA